MAKRIGIGQVTKRRIPATSACSYPILVAQLSATTVYTFRRELPLAEVSSFPMPYTTGSAVGPTRRTRWIIDLPLPLSLSFPK